GLVVALESLPRAAGAGNELTSFAWIGGVILFVVWAVVLAAVGNYRIKPAEITDRTIRLANVAPEFVEAVEEEEDAYRRGRDDYDARQPRLPRGDEPRPRSDDDRYQK